MTKIFFLALWYSAVYPAGFFMASLALFVNYFTDRFSLMRTWKRAPQVGTEVSKISRKYFFSLANVAMAVISSLYWSGYPYDNLCDTGQDVNSTYPAYSGSHNLTLGRSDDLLGFYIPLAESEPTFINITISPEDPVYKYCLQDLLRLGYSISFPFIPSQQDKREGEWMTPEQEQVSAVFGWTAVAVIGLVSIRLLLGAYKAFEERIVGDYKVCGRGKWKLFSCTTTLSHTLCFLLCSLMKATGDDQNINWSEVPHISSYIPQVKSPFFSYPLLVVETDTVDPTLYDW
jgi:hypothetical protein